MIIIVGAGLAGLACANRLDQAGLDYLLLESASKPGGRVATQITEEGYRLDEGFQVLLDSYPTARRLLNLPALNPRYFQSGALMMNMKGESEQLLNPLAHPEWIAGGVFSSFSWGEKISLATYAAMQLLRSDEELLSKELGHSTMEEIRRLGLSGEILERFLRPFFAGVFLDNDLATDASVFRYDLKKFAMGRALIPAMGMGALPEQLATRLQQDRIRYNAGVRVLHRKGNRFIGVELENGELIECQQLVLATDERTTRRLLELPPAPKWLGVTTLYFTGDEPLYEGALLVLPQWPESSSRLVRHFTDLTNTAPEYAPEGKRLLSATILSSSIMNGVSLATMAQAEIAALFPTFTHWNFLKEITIPRALPIRTPGSEKILLSSHYAPNLLLAGDQITNASIESALASGERVAEDILRGF